MFSKTTGLPSVIDTIVENSGLFGIFSRPGAGKTTLLMYLLHRINEQYQTNTLVLAVEMSKQQWETRIQLLDIPAPKAIICDDIEWSLEKLEEIICKTQSKIVAIDYLQLLDFDVADLKCLAEKLSVSFIIIGVLSYRKPVLNNENYPKYFEYFDYLMYLQRRPFSRQTFFKEQRRSSILSIEKNQFGTLFSCELDFTNVANRLGVNN